MTLRCAISQPTFIPWLGWFDLALQADVMILLDTVKFEKQSWQQRNRIRTAQGLQLVTVPVRISGRSSQTIAEVELADPSFGPRLLRTLSTTYGRAPFYHLVMADLEPALEVSLATGRLVEVNVALISVLARWLRIQTPMPLASTMSAKGHRGGYIANLCTELGANEYLSTPGAEAYLREDLDAFTRRDIRVLIHHLTHPEYLQLHSPFVPYASALDLVMMAGPESGDILRNSHRDWFTLEPT